MTGGLLGEAGIGNGCVVMRLYESGLLYLLLGKSYEESDSAIEDAVFTLYTVKAQVFIRAASCPELSENIRQLETLCLCDLNYKGINVRRTKRIVVPQCSKNLLTGFTSNVHRTNANFVRLPFFVLDPFRV
jgi:hypothetical protein